jgi:uncharacterized protein
MLDRSIPAYVDTRKIFLAQEHISGILSLQRLPRFCQSLSNNDGLVHIELNFTLSRTKQRLISGKLKAEVNVFCQRCLKPLGIELTDDIKLALVRDEEAAKGLEAELDPWIFEGFKMDPAELIEEQLILCMPLVSYHHSGDCINSRNYVSGASAAESHTDARASESPFAVLKSLKNSDSSN